MKLTGLEYHLRVKNQGKGQVPGGTWDPRNLRAKRHYLCGVSGRFGGLESLFSWFLIRSRMASSSILFIFQWKSKKAPESPKGGSKSNPGAREKRVMFDLFNKKIITKREKSMILMG